MPPWSRTWRLLERIFRGGREAVLRSGRFADALFNGGALVAMMFVPNQSTGVCIGPDWLPSDRTVLHGKVLHASCAAYERAAYQRRRRRSGCRHLLPQIRQLVASR